MLTTYIATNTEQAQMMIATEGCLMPSPELLEGMHPLHKIHTAYRMCTFFMPRHRYEYMYKSTIEECYYAALEDIISSVENDSHLAYIDVTYLDIDECIELVEEYGDLI